MVSTISFTQEHTHHHSHHIHQPRAIVRSHEVNDLHSIIDIPDRPSHENRIGSPIVSISSTELKKYKVKVVAATAIITSLITAGVFVVIHLTSC
jgi:hypothetical protein